MGCKVFFPTRDAVLDMSRPAFSHACAAFRVSVKFCPNKNLSMDAASAAFLPTILKDGLVNALLVRESLKGWSASKCMPSEKDKRAERTSAFRSCKTSGFNSIDIPEPKALRQAATCAWDRAWYSSRLITDGVKAGISSLLSLGEANAAKSALTSYLDRRVERVSSLRPTRALVLTEFKITGFQSEDVASDWSPPNKSLVITCDSDKT